MNLKQIKTDLENSIREVVQNLLRNNVTINVVYNIEQGAATLAMTEPRKDENDQIKDILFYNLSFVEEDSRLSVLAFDRVYKYDDLGIASVDTAPIVIDDNFITTMRNAIMYGIDRVYHPERYTMETEVQNGEGPVEGAADVTEAPAENGPVLEQTGASNEGESKRDVVAASADEADGKDNA